MLLQVKHKVTKWSNCFNVSVRLATCRRRLYPLKCRFMIATGYIVIQQNSSPAIQSYDQVICTYGRGSNVSFRQFLLYNVYDVTYFRFGIFKCDCFSLLKISCINPGQVNICNLQFVMYIFAHFFIVVVWSILK